MAGSPASSDLSDPPSVDSDAEDNLSTAVPSSRPSADIAPAEVEHLAPLPKRRKTGPAKASASERAPSTQPADDDDNISLSEDGWSDGPGEDDDEYALREQAQVQCLWRDCDFGMALNNDDLVRHVQGTHCATGGPKRTKYLCEWGECQNKLSQHPSGYALKAHMRSHTKEKPYYCALPECDKAFTRSDALAKHMRTVHEPELSKGNAANSKDEPTPPGRKSAKLKLTNGNAASKLALPPTETGPTHDEDGNEVDPSPPNDNITYIPAHHPITGQPGFMIHYPPDIVFSSWESSIPADQLMRLLRRQLHWAGKEGDALKAEVEELELQKREEWIMKEILLQGVLEAELSNAETEGLLDDVDARVLASMENDAGPARQFAWTGEEPDSRRPKAARRRSAENTQMNSGAQTPERQRADSSPSPPPTGASGGFDGDADPYDNWLTAQETRFEQLRQARETPAKSKSQQQVAEDDAVGALMGMGGRDH